MNRRIQRKRIKGWKMPENTVYVGRPTMWGNPFRLMDDMIYFNAHYRRSAFSKWVLYYPDGGHTPEEVVKLFRDLIMNPHSHPVEDQIREQIQLIRDRIGDLGGKDLACFCKEGEPCHADVYLEFTNH